MMVGSDYSTKQMLDLEEFVFKNRENRQLLVKAGCVVSKMIVIGLSEMQHNMMTRPRLVMLSMENMFPWLLQLAWMVKQRSLVSFFKEPVSHRGRMMPSLICYYDKDTQWRFRSKVNDLFC